MFGEDFEQIFFFFLVDVFVFHSVVFFVAAEAGVDDVDVVFLYVFVFVFVDFFHVDDVVVVVVFVVVVFFFLFVFEGVVAFFGVVDDVFADSAAFVAVFVVDEVVFVGEVDEEEFVDVAADDVDDAENHFVELVEDDFVHDDCVAGDVVQKNFDSFFDDEGSLQFDVAFENDLETLKHFEPVRGRRPQRRFGFVVVEVVVEEGEIFVVVVEVVGVFFVDVVFVVVDFVEFVRGENFADDLAL